MHRWKHGARKYKMIPHQENGAKLKKETQCPCTYKNKLILLSSHCENIFVSGPKIHTKRLRLHWLSFKPATVSYNQLIYIYTDDQWERSIYRYRGKNCATDPRTHDFSHLQTVMYSHPISFANYRLTFKTLNKVQVFKGVYSKIRLYNNLTKQYYTQ